MNSWIILILAGICEIVWALGLKFSEGLTKPMQSAITIAFMVLSLYLLAVASRHIPIGISYSVWVGIGAFGTLVGSMLLFGDKINFIQLMFCITLVISVLGIKLSAIDM
ncbi:MAG: multidrug efflux SMR transporter [Proteobacteria bacterium]|nr:multidrug efflux SMR transporter [Pseudomonadota bacterium]